VVGFFIWYTLGNRSSSHATCFHELPIAIVIGQRVELWDDRMKFDRIKRLVKNLTLADLMLPAIFLLMAGWAWIEYSLGYKLYGLLIVVFSFGLAINRKRYSIFLAIAVLVIIYLLTPVIDTLLLIKQSNLAFIQSPGESLINILSPDSGQNVLPEPVQQMLSLLHTHQVESYQISDLLNKNTLIKQRIVEAAWPIKMESTSPYHLLLLEEINNDSNCTVIDRRKDIALEYCP
jgi:hypothetical protein